MGLLAHRAYFEVVVFKRSIFSEKPDFLVRYKSCRLSSGEGAGTANELLLVF